MCSVVDRVVTSPKLVASIQTALSERVNGRAKDPGRLDPRRKAKSEKVSAPVKTRSGGKIRPEKATSAPLPPKKTAETSERRPFRSRFDPAVREERRMKMEAEKNRRGRSMDSSKRKPSAGTTAGRKTTPATSEAGASTRSRSADYSRKVAADDEPGEQSDPDVEGRPLRMRGPPSEEQCDSELEGDEEWEENWTSGQDYSDNLTWHGDSLSIAKGHVDTPAGKDLPAWVITDTGSMTSLIQDSVVRALKLERKKVPESKQFSIASPGGGADYVEEYVIFPIKIMCKRELASEEAYDDCESPEETITIPMRFGICESLPVPILWGGRQMRRYGLLDHFESRVLSLKIQGERFITKSMSWLAATMEMKEEAQGRARKAYLPFIPSRARLTNVVMGGRRAINMPAILYPGESNIVRVSRHNARVDEGHNQVLIENKEEVARMYGDWVVPVESVVNGEAFVIVMNNSERPVRLAPGVLKLTIKPVVEFPKIFKPRELERPVEVSDAEAKEMPRDMFVNNSVERVDEGRALGPAQKDPVDFLRFYDRGPQRLMTWNCNGLAPRMRTPVEVHQRSDIELFYERVNLNKPDLISLQEIRLECEPGNHGEVKRGSSDEATWNTFMGRLKYDYDVYLSLSSNKYGGQAVLVNKALEAPKVEYNMGGERGHYKSGRFIKLEFSDLVIRSVYAPFNGAGKAEAHARRRAWDERLKEEMMDPGLGAKARILMGDLNVVYQDRDITGSPEFWAGQGDQTVPWGDRGFGGTTPNERDRFKDIMREGGMADTYSVPMSHWGEAMHTFRGQGKFAGKSMKLDYILADDTLALSGGVDSTAVLANTVSRVDFMGSDHAPLICVLHPRWKSRRAWLLDFREKWAPLEESRQVNTMFTGTTAAKSLPKVVKGLAKESPPRHKGMSTPRPDAFPEDLWDYVDPDQRPLVSERYSGYKSREYLDECLESIRTKLHIQPREEYFTPTWFSPASERPALQEFFLRAQALANPQTYYFPDPDVVALAKDVVAEVVTTSERPFKCRPRKLSVVQQAFLQAKTNIMLRMKQLEEAKSEWCHGLVLVAYPDRIQAFTEKHGDDAMEKMFESEHEVEVATFFRLCIDLRMLNARTIPDRFPLPRIDTLLEGIPRSCGRYSISDIADAFFKCELLKEHRHKTAFRTHDRHLQFAVLPQGFINSPSVFCRLIARTFEGMHRERFSAYIDDVLLHVDDFQTHMDTQQDLYDRLWKAGLTLKLSKTHLNCTEVKFLGHILTKDGRLPDPEAVEAIREWKDPTSTKEVRSFLGSTLYYREYIHDYSDMAMPLYDLIKKGVVVDKVWDDEVHGRACQRIKDALTSRPVLMHVDNSKPFRLKVDACRVGRGLGCILEQQNCEEKWQPVSYYSSSLSKEERNYSATELECKALHDCILHYAVYLKYIPHFEVFSDHNALRYMVNSDNTTTNGRLMRYLLALQEYNFSIYYRKGTENCDADAVSRLLRRSDTPSYLTEDELSRENGVVSKAMLERARALDKRNEKLEKTAKKLSNRLARKELTEMSLLNDHILSEGVENLESESGRARFFENLQACGLQCSRATLDNTLQEMKEDQGEAQEEELLLLTGMVHQLVDNRDYCGHQEQEGGGQPSCMRGSESDCESGGSRESEGDYSSFEDSLADSRTDMDESLVCGSCREEFTSLKEPVIPDYGAGIAHSREEIPKMISLMVEAVEAQVEEWERCRPARAGNRDKLVNASTSLPAKTAFPPVARLEAIRSAVVDRVEKRSRRTVGMTAQSYSLRPTKKVDYLKLAASGGLVHPNWKHFPTELTTHPVNQKLVAAKRMGHKSCVVRESLIPGDTGWGLFARKSIPAKQEICSYEGLEVPLETLQAGGYKDTDYVVEAIKNQKTRERICMDSPHEASCFGRYAQDPINEDLVNAKIVWRKGRMVVIATIPIRPGDEIYVHYGLDYWADKLDYLDKTSRALIEPRILKAKRGAPEYKKGVRFEGETSVATFEEDNAVDEMPGLVQEDGELLNPPAVDYQTRMEQYELQEGDDSPEAEKLRLDQTILDELAIENVEETQQLADSLQFLVGRKFEDEGRLYEIMRVQYDRVWERVIGFRRPLSGKTPKRDDGSPFCVYGKEGLYELSELYYLHHPESRERVPWPSDDDAWALMQEADPDLRAILDKLRDQGGGYLKEGRHKYGVKRTSNGHGGLLIREVKDLRKGLLQQAMVPKELVIPTLRMHHEGYGHMGSNRMLETIRLRYFWINMDQDIIEHAGACINCKLRKTYQRRPKVPIMKYDDTSRPLDRVHVDLTGPLPETRAKHKYIMVVKDYLTKYVWLIPLKNKTAYTVAEAFVGEFVCQAGIPGRLVSDRGNEFVNQLLNEISKVMGINRISTTPYNPRADGFVENHNKTLKDQLFHYVDNLKQDDWDVFLPTVQLMYNTTVSLSTGYTPMLLLTGREARMPSLNHMESTNVGLTADILSNELVRRMVETCRHYHEHALAQTSKNKGRFDIQVRQPLEFVEYEVGQQFMRTRRPYSSFKSADEKEAWKISAKLLERYEGPYRITRKVNPVLYEAEIDGKTVRVHAVNMKPF